MAVSRTVGMSLSFVLAACGSDEVTKAGPCGRSELSACGISCSATSVCPAGLYCERGVCQAQCTAASVAGDCGAAKSCTSEGRCADAPSLQGATAGDGGGQSDSSVGSGSGTGTAGGPSASGDSSVCGEVVLDTSPKTPNVMLIIDQSSSMRNPFGSSTRWEALKASLLADDGLISELQHVVRFGATWYSASNGEETAVTECPHLTEVNIMLDNFAAIRAAYPADMIEDTPTGDSIEAVLARLQQNSVLDPSSSEDPTIFVLATDGEPDTCEQLDPQEGQQEAIDAVKHAYSLGIRSYVLAVADEQEISQEHINALANAGVGNTSAAPAPSYRVDSDQGLRDALQEIVGGVVTCEVKLEGTVTGDPCEGTVSIGGTQLSCNDADGFELVSSSLIRLNGAACEQLKAGQQLLAAFPCGVAIPI